MNATNESIYKLQDLHYCDQKKNALQKFYINKKNGNLQKKSCYFPLGLNKARSLKLI